eukprot:scaffold631_cov318-Pavlova_lutheri.AAC.10
MHYPTDEEHIPNHATPGGRRRRGRDRPIPCDAVAAKQREETTRPAVSCAPPGVEKCMRHQRA